MTITPIARVPALTAIDVTDPGLAPDRRAGMVADLARIHARHFPAYTFYTDQLASGVEFPDTIVHPWLLFVDGTVVGEFVFHTCLKRGVVHIQYVGMNAAGIAALPVGWLAEVTDFAVEMGQREAVEAGFEVLAAAGEIYRNPPDLRRWRRKGFLILALDYCEPVGGRDWALRPADFSPLALGVRPTPAGWAAGEVAVAQAVLSAFLLDYYGLPADHPQVVRMFGEAERLGLTEMPDDLIGG